MRFEGIYTPIITTFRDDLSIDFDAYGKVIDWQSENGCHGIIVGGSTGEFFSLTHEERIAQFSFAVGRAAGRLPVIAGVNDLLAERCYELTAAARDAGADALLVAAPPYGLPSQKELIFALSENRPHRQPAHHVVQLSRSNRRIHGRNFLERIAQSRNFCAIKESSGDINRIHMLAREHTQLQLSAGAEDQALEFFAWGARSWVSVVANFFPREAVRFYERCVIEGDFDCGRKIMSALLPLTNCLEKGDKFLQCVKYACELLGRPGGPVRPPMKPMKKELRREVLQIVETAQSTIGAILKETE